MAEFMKVLLVMDIPISLDYAPTSRIYYIGRVLNRYAIETVILPNNNEIFRFLDGKSKIKKYLRRAYLFFYMLFIIKKKKINYILARGKYICIEAIILARLYGIKTIFDFHGYVYKEEIFMGRKYKAILTKLLEEICIKNSNIVITQNMINKSIANNLNKKVLVLENGVDLEEFNGLSSSKDILKKYSIASKDPIVGFVGNWGYLKIEDLLNASKYLKDSTIVVIGEGKNFSTYRNEFKNVIFTGRIPHKHAISILMNSDICVSPHMKDKIMKYRSPRKTLEYMAAKKPIIVSNVIWKESFLTEGVNCLVYEPENPKDLAEKIRILIRNSKLKDTIGKNNRELSKEFTWEKAVYRSGLLRSLKK